MEVHKAFLYMVITGILLSIYPNQGSEKGLFILPGAPVAWGQSSPDSSAIRAFLPPNSVLEQVDFINRDIIVVFKQLETLRDTTGQIWWGALRRGEVRRGKFHLFWVWKVPTFGKNYENLFIKGLNPEGVLEIMLFTTSGAHRTYLDAVLFDGKTYKTLNGEYFTRFRYNNPQYLTEFLTADEGIWLSDLDKDGNVEILSASRYHWSEYMLGIYKWEYGQYVMRERKQVTKEQLLKLMESSMGDSYQDGHI
jgi:hypothetical protein